MPRDLASQVSQDCLYDALRGSTVEADRTFNNKGSPELPARSDVATLRAAAAAQVDKLLAGLPSLAEDVRRLVSVKFAASQKLPDDTTDEDVLALGRRTPLLQVCTPHATLFVWLFSVVWPDTHAAYCGGPATTHGAELLHALPA